MSNLFILRFLGYLSRVFSAPKKNSCYFCNFCDIRGYFGPLLGFFFFLSLEFCEICNFCDFCDISHRCFKLARKILVTFAIFADISGPLLISSFSKSGILLHLLFFRFLRYLSRVFLARKKNPCYFCDFCDICGHFGPFLVFFFF